MKPKFALDLSHEGINLLHRSKGGWSLVGSVALDDANMGPHLAGLRRRAAELESGGFTCKIIIPNSQILYTTVEAPGPDDIAREVQIRSGLDGVTPYPVGELVFDWRAAGERARVAVLARDTMDEAETFAVENKFNPVSFVARPPQGEFSGEPFFGKTRAATKILGPTERVEPDASPVPRRPPAIEKAPPSGAVSAAVAAAAAALDENPFAEPATGRRHAFPPQDLAPPPVPEPLDEPLPESPPAPVALSADDPFAELDAIQAELSGDPSAAPPSFRSRADQGRARPASPTRDTAAQHPAPPPLAPFPPTSDEEAGAKSSPPPARKPRASGKPTAPPSQPPQARATPGPQTGATPSGAPKPASTPAAGKSPAGRRSTPSRNFAPSADTPARKPGPGPAPATAARIEGDTPVAPGVAFSTRRNGNGSDPVTTATPTARPGGSGSKDTARQPQTAAGSASGAPAPGKAAPESPARGARKDMLPSDRRRADMANALARPLPGTPGAKPEAPAGPADSGPRGSLSGAMRGAASGLRSFGQRRTARKPDPAQPGQPGTDQPASAQRGAAPDEPRSSMAELMRGAGSSAARISPDQPADEPNLLAPDIADTGRPRSDAAAPDKASTPPGAPAKPPAAKPVAPTAPSTPAAHAPAAAPTPAGAAPSDAAPAKRAGSPAAASDDSRKVQAQPKKPAFEPKPAEKSDGINVFGARGVPEQREGRKYLGLILTLLLILGMALIAFWSNLFVDTANPPLFNPGDTPSVAPEAEPADVDPATPVPPAAGPVPVPVETGDTPPVDDQPDAAPDATATDLPPTPQVLTPEEAEARYGETQIWQRAPETMAEPRAPALDFGDIGGPGALRGEPSDTGLGDTGLDDTGLDDAPAVSSPAGSAPDRADPLPPPPADTLFELDANGLVAPSPGGTVSPTGIVVFEGPPEIIPPARPFTPEPEAAAPDAVPDTPFIEAAVDPATANQPVAPLDTPDLRPAPRPEDLPAGLLPAPEAAEPEAADPDAPLPGDANLGPEGAGTDTAVDTAALATETTAPVDAAALAAAETPRPPSRPGDLVVPTAVSAADAAAIEAAVDSATADLIDATELAVAASIKPSHRPADFDSIVRAATARAAAAPPPPAAAPATTTPSIPTSASVADQATTSNAINLREINLLGISGPSNARRALVRMANGRYVTVKVGDRLDGGRVTSITDTGLTYQKGSRNLALQLLPLG